MIKSIFFRVGNVGITCRGRVMVVITVRTMMVILFFLVINSIIGLGKFDNYWC